MLKSEVKKIDEALTLLDDAARDEARAIGKMISKDYRALRNTLQEVTPEVASKIQDMKDASVENFRKAKERTSEYTKETAKKIDSDAKKNPWRYVGGATAIGVVAGFFLGSKFNK